MSLTDTRASEERTPLARKRNAAAFFSLSQTLRRLAHRAKREALEWEQKGNAFNYTTMRHESDSLWRKAKYYLNMARRDWGEV